ncbi:protein AF-10 isoform X2 [Brienomyrus brachyistius]|uniref:protein AF-10 isoform X2 n=1 Tax=Brienomyrus brachyistius TaxID=42636 RepID=UPI0020B1BBB6|nr:protein AF-10 isoform X2 [Brienomyrus brachyistius]
MVSSEPSLAVEDDYIANNMKEMIGGCCVCSDERGWAENPLVYCDGHGCNVAVHQACYGIVQVPTGPWFCRKCESQERAARVIKGWKGRKANQQAPDGGGRSATHHKDAEDEGLAKSLKTMNTWRCELCPHKDGALKRTDNGGWAHVVCALYIPEVEFANVSTMEPIVLQSVPHERYNKTCYICEDQGRESKAATGACMTCNKHGCRQAFHVTCAQFAGLLCEEQGSDADNVKYCGYCKHHYGKLRRSKGRGSRAQSLSDSSSHSLDKHHDKDKKKHKERDKHKPRHKKSLEPSPALAPALSVPTEKSYASGGSGSIPTVPTSQKRQDDSSGRFTNANFQEVPAHPGGGAKDGPASEGKGTSESKAKRPGSHSSGQRGRKSTPGKPSLAVSITSASAGPATSTSSSFQQGLLLGSGGTSKTTSSVSGGPPSSDFLGFSEAELRAESSYPPPPFGGGPGKAAGEGVPSSGNFSSSIGPVPSSASSGGKPYESSLPTGEMRGSLASLAHKRPPPPSSGRGLAGSQSEEAPVKGKKRRGKWRNRYGPCWAHDAVKGVELPSSASPSSSSSSTALVPGGANPASLSANGSGGIQKSPSLLRNGGLLSHHVSSSPARPGAFPGSDVLVPLPTVVSSPGTPLSSAELPQQPLGGTSLPSVPTAPSTACTYSNALSGSSFNLAPPHMFGNRLNPNSAMTTLFAQSEGPPTDLELGDTGFSGRSTSPKASLSPRSPVSGLNIRYDSSGLAAPGPAVNGASSALPVATSIEQLLDRQWNEGQQFLLQHGAPGVSGDLLAMLRSLHQLQTENRRLEEQIRTLTVKKERLQLLSAQLAVPFPSASSAASTSSTSTPAASSPQLPGAGLHADVLNSSKSPQLGSTFLPDSALPLPLPLAAQDNTPSSHSSSSALSTPPSVGHGSPPSVQQQLQVNGAPGGAMQSVAPAAAAGTLPAMPGVTGLMGAIQGGQLAMNGIVGALNGVIQTSPSLAQNTNTLPHPGGVSSIPLTISSSLNNSSTTPGKTSAPGLGLLSEQQRQILLHQQQLQQLFSSPQPTPQEQHQALIYQLMQQQQQQQQHDLQQLQHLSSSQLPVNSLLPTAQSTITTNPFLAMHTEASQKAARLAEKGGVVTGQEKS